MERIFQHYGLNYPLISSIITTLQKLVALFFVGFTLYHGTIFTFFNQYLTPRKPGWFNFYFKEDLKECKNLYSILFHYNCAKNLLIVDDSEVLHAISEMPPRTKWQYLMTVRSSKFIAPYVVQACVILTGIFLLICIISFIQKMLQFCGDFFRGTMLKYILDWASFSHVLQILSFIAASSVASYLLCLLTSGYYGDCTVCEDAFCLYCIRRLSCTIFKDFDMIGGVVSLFSICVMSFAVFLTSIILTSLLYFFTVVFISLVIHTVVDAVTSLYETVKSILGNRSDYPVLSVTGVVCINLRSFKNIFKR